MLVKWFIFFMELIPLLGFPYIYMKYIEIPDKSIREGLSDWIHESDEDI